MDELNDASLFSINHNKFGKVREKLLQLNDLLADARLKQSTIFHRLKDSLVKFEEDLAQSQSETTALVGTTLALLAETKEANGTFEELTIKRVTDAGQKEQQSQQEPNATYIVSSPKISMFGKVDDGHKEKGGGSEEEAIVEEEADDGQKEKGEIEGEAAMEEEADDGQKEKEVSEEETIVEEEADDGQKEKGEIEGEGTMEEEAKGGKKEKGESEDVCRQKKDKVDKVIGQNKENCEEEGDQEKGGTEVEKEGEKEDQTVREEGEKRKDQKEEEKVMEEDKTAGKEAKEQDEIEEEKATEKEGKTMEDREEKRTNQTEEEKAKDKDGIVEEKDRKQSKTVEEEAEKEEGDKTVGRDDENEVQTVDQREQEEKAGFALSKDKKKKKTNEQDTHALERTNVEEEKQVDQKTGDKEIPQKGFVKEDETRGSLGLTKSLLELIESDARMEQTVEDADEMEEEQSEEMGKQVKKQKVPMKESVIELVRKKLFRHFVFAFNALSKAKRGPIDEVAFQEELCTLVTKMGGKVWHSAEENFTHLITEYCDSKSDKYKLCRLLKLPVLRPSWIYAAAEAKDFEALNAVLTDVFIKTHKTPIFTECSITVSGFVGFDRIEIGRLIELHGGLFTGQMCRASCTHLIASSNSGEKYKRAREWGTVHVVTKKWLDKCVETGYRLPENHFSLDSDREKRRSSPDIERNGIAKQKTNLAPLVKKMKVDNPMSSPWGRVVKREH